MVGQGQHLTITAAVSIGIQVITTALTKQHVQAPSLLRTETVCPSQATADHPSLIDYQAGSDDIIKSRCLGPGPDIVLQGSTDHHGAVALLLVPMMSVL